MIGEQTGPQTASTLADLARVLGGLPVTTPILWAESEATEGFTIEVNVVKINGHPHVFFMPVGIAVTA